MAYYKIELVGGPRKDRQVFASEWRLIPADYTGHCVCFVIEHPADEMTFRKSYESIAASQPFEIEIEKIGKARFLELYTKRAGL